MPDDFEDDEEQPCRRESDRALSQLRRDLESKHQQNRKDIHAIRNDQQKIVLDLAKLEGKIMPLVDNGQPGLISRMVTKLEEVADTLTEVRVAQGTAAGRRTETDWLRDGVKALIVGVIVALVAHFWK